ncbi:MAG: spore coat protein CotJB [Oscillospiraceae bacterium]|nr:spore coat protein CotJB [Oscillospiraceae bacterium]
MGIEIERNRAVLLNKISKAGFALNDLALYLDTHPTDVNALRYYEYYQKKHDEFTNEYESKYGPLTRKITNNSGKWTWYEGPWPWEREYNEEI